ncbi:helix-turn-helix domain-containing protein [Amycolatopsis acidicola]|uniref:Helix-turn-helix domain-containing protein n=1 Tax=Amycolatopsis acidicola TaxID=2596893 RepID=A0A5N0V0S2_9PSEU|nr:helix-turn-helix domain-containing protein [Amycolatopsis acidicola]KAA9159986.1 helix-turn-helix domain-containing protein [Amycolatopsis acidicola]
MSPAAAPALNETDPVSVYRELPGAGVLRCWWEQRVHEMPKMQRVLPDACADVLVSADGEASLIGPTMSVALHDLRPGTSFRAVRFQPGALRSALGLSAAEVRDQVLPLTSVLPDRAARLLAEQVWACRFPEALRPIGFDPRVREAVRLLWSWRDVDRVAAELGLTARHLRRLLVENAGVGPKAVQRVGRLQRFLTFAEQCYPVATLADLAAEAGYADQAHLAREVRDLAGLPPSALLRERSASGVETAGAGADRLG